MNEGDKCDLNTKILLTDMVSGLLSKAWVMVEGDLNEDQSCVLTRGKRIAKVFIDKNTVIGVVTQWEPDQDDSDGTEGQQEESGL